MERDRVPKPGEFYRHFKDRLYQVITVATHTETGESMVIYQALYGAFKTYVRPLSMFLGEVDHEKYPMVKQKYRFEQITEPHSIDEHQYHEKVELSSQSDEIPVVDENRFVNQESVNHILLQFLDAGSYSKKLEVISSNQKHLSDRLINDMAVSLDCTVEEGPLEVRIQGLILCLQAMCRFEDRRKR